MRVTLDLNKSVEENASFYFDRAKKLKKKREGALRTIEDTKRKLQRIEKRIDTTAPARKVVRKKKWYEKFRWFFTSEGYLCIGGRDATSNEIIIKKHAEPHDIVFHTDMAGSPFFVLKTEGNEPKDSIREVADATATFSRAFKMGMTNSSVFMAKPEQITKQAESGEFLPKGAFVVRGKVTYLDNSINLALGSYDDTVMAGPKESIEANCTEFVVVSQGDKKANDVAKQIKRKIGGEIDDIVRSLPTGSYSLRNF
ncbi:MAG: NFACT RNA binding domain-containing protein [Candidatus Woesearchaeota archaeon]